MSKEKYLLEEYRPLVLKIAGGFQRKLPINILREDIVAAGMAGLWDALRRNPHRENDESFEWYVRVRIRGAILDELRTQDWLPRRARAVAAVEDVPPPAITRMEDMASWDQERALSYECEYEEQIDAAQQHRALLSYIDDLPLRERVIAIEHYFNGQKFKDIAATLGVSEPRISQINARLIARLRQFAKDNDSLRHVL